VDCAESERFAELTRDSAVSAHALRFSYERMRGDTLTQTRRADWPRNLQKAMPQLSALAAPHPCVDAANEQ